MAEVAYRDEFGAWWDSLDEADQDAVQFSVSLLRQFGVGLGHPHSSAIKGSRHPLRELRCQSSGRPLRVLYAYNPARDAVMIIGGDKTGDNRFYERTRPARVRDSGKAVVVSAGVTGAIMARPVR